MRPTITMNKDSLYTLFIFLGLGYFILRSVGRSKKSEEEASQNPPPPQKTPARSEPAVFFQNNLPPQPLFREKKTGARRPKNSRASHIRKLAKSGKDWVVLSEVLKKVDEA